jgi:hypothetical protein
LLEGTLPLGIPDLRGLWVVTIAGRKTSLLTGLDLREAWFVGREVEDFLGLESQQEYPSPEWEERLMDQNAQNCGRCCSR